MTKSERSARKFQKPQPRGRRARGARDGTLRDGQDAVVQQEAGGRVAAPQATRGEAPPPERPLLELRQSEGLGLSGRQQRRLRRLRGLCVFGRGVGDLDLGG